MTHTVALGTRRVGRDEPVLVVAELGINHNGDLNLCRQLMKASAEAGCEFVKFQKRTVDVVYSPEELARPRENPFGPTNGDLKRGLEFGREEYDEIDSFASGLGIAWTASCWDEASVDFLEQYNPPFFKIASASLTDDGLLRHHRATGRPLVLSTGMSSIEQIDHAVELLGTDQLVLMQCTSTYPSPPNELNLRAIKTLADRYSVPIGFSAHDANLATSTAAVALGACVIERHVTMDRDLWGSDQTASIEPNELAQLVSDIRKVELALGDGAKRVYDSEIPVREKLRRIS